LATTKGFAHHRGMEGGGGGLSRPDAKKVGGGGKEAAASVEPGWPREAAQVSGFRGLVTSHIESIKKTYLSME
jgi:hypothetical protein